MPGLSFDLSLYLVAGTDDVGGRDLADVVAAAVRGGVSLVQLREKQASDAEVAALARRLLAVLQPHGIPLIINDRLEVACGLAGTGLHLGQDDMAPAAARRALGPERILGVSAGLPEEMAIVDPDIADYVGVGPVYPTGSKADAGDRIGLDGLRDMRCRIALPVVAIGGITAARAGDVMAQGVEGVAVVSAICAAPDPEAAARALRDVISKTRR